MQACDRRDSDDRLVPRDALGVLRAEVGGGLADEGERSGVLSGREAGQHQSEGEERDRRAYVDLEHELVSLGRRGVKHLVGGKSKGREKSDLVQRRWG